MNVRSPQLNRVVEHSTTRQSSAVVISGVSRSFGAVKALSKASLVIPSGEKLGLIGHNGAGKSTLMNVLSGVMKPDEGGFTVGGQQHSELTPALAHELGIRCIFQELSLCPNLTVIENTLVKHPDLAGWGWRGRARKLISACLDRIFPGHDIDVGRRLGVLTIAQRQMVEIAEAFVLSEGVRLVILDEPTSSLDAKAAEQLMRFLDAASRTGVATILISHRLQEILDNSERVVVMVDGRIVGDAPAKSLTRQSLVEMMGHSNAGARDELTRPAGEASGEVVLAARGDAGDPLRLILKRGEIVGFAGLDGHGQRRTLQHIFAEAFRGRNGLLKSSVAYVPGDRQTEGVFPAWSAGENVTVRALRDVSRNGVINLARERLLAEDWFRRIGVRSAGGEAGITTLSGGNQQKVLFARALASKATLILLDDPMRGVDVGTKNEVYAMIRNEAASGRSFIWYSTETEELRNCDRVYVFRLGRIAAVLDSGAVTEENILRASFTEPVSAGAARG